MKEQEVLQESLSEHPFLQLVDQERDYSLPTFNISLDENECYEVRDGNSHRILNTPVFLRSEADSLNSLSSILGHLTTFKFFEGIENDKLDKHFEESVRIDTSCKLESDGWIKIRDQETFDFSITNLSKRSLYLSVFNLRSSWQICNMIAEAQAGSFHEIAAEDDEMTFPITMEIPEQMKGNGGSCNEDIFKIFVTDQPPYFPFQVLPKLGDGGTRDHLGTHELVRCLESLQKGYWATRQTGPGHWMTRNFLIRTYV